MDGFLSWLFAFMTSLMQGVRSILDGVITGIVKIFDLPSHLTLLRSYSDQFGVADWVSAILVFLLTMAFLLLLVVLAVLGVRRYLRFHRAAVDREQLLHRIADLHRETERLTRENAKLMQLYGDSESGEGRSDDVIRDRTLSQQIGSPAKLGRFCRLSAIDDRYADAVPSCRPCMLSLEELCTEFRNFAASGLRLYYEPRVVRLLFAGLAAGKLMILEGISGTGKTSLPYALGKFFVNDVTVASVQPSWTERAELFGYFNEFTKKYQETDVLCRIYEASYRDDVNLIVLDEMNIARIEHYFAEVLSLLELPDNDMRKVRLVPSAWEEDPAQLSDGMLSVPPNVWYVGTANHDETTYAISDKVYDRAVTIRLDSKGVPFEAPAVAPRAVSYRYLEEQFARACEQYPVGEEDLSRIAEIDSYLLEHFHVSFGNRVMKQLCVFVPVYVACGGEAVEAIDHMLATKVLRKLEALHPTRIREELDGLCTRLDVLFGDGRMSECAAYLKQLEKRY